MNTQDRGTEATVWTKERERALAEPLDMKLTAHRDAFDGGKRKLTYLEGHVIIAQLNRIFGYNGWSYSLDQHGVDEHTEGQPQEWYAQFWAVVTLEIGGVRRQDMGTSEIQNSTRRNNVRNADARSTGRKAAVTDALKRAARTFGSQFGNSLYDVDDDVYAWMAAHSLEEGDASPAPAPATPQASAAAVRPTGPTVTASVSQPVVTPTTTDPHAARRTPSADPEEWPRSAADWSGDQLRQRIEESAGGALLTGKDWKALARDQGVPEPTSAAELGSRTWLHGLYQAMRAQEYAEMIALCTSEEQVTNLVSEAIGERDHRRISAQQYSDLSQAGEARKAELSAPLLAGAGAQPQAQARAQVAS